MPLEEFNLTGSVKLVIKENVLAVICDNTLMAVSSAFYNGGTKQIKAVLNVGVPEGYNDRSLHLDPLALITSSAAKLGFTKDYLAMVTAAKISNYSLVTKKADNFSVTVAATAGCKHGESSGEEMDVQEISGGTINIIVLIDGMPTESCMVASVITATEAKSAALRDLDVRSLYTGDSATGSITDSVTIASTNQGKTISYGGPASKLGKLVGHCTRKAVAEALVKQEPFWKNRTVIDRLKERHLHIEQLSTEISKVEGLAIDTKSLETILEDMPAASAFLLAAAKMDDDYKKNLLPDIDGNSEMMTKCFDNLATLTRNSSKPAGYDSVDLPPFVKNALISIVQEAYSKH